MRRVQAATERGVIAGLILYAIAAAAVLGAIWGAYAYVDHTWETTAGIARGKEITRAEWNAANRQAEDEQLAAARVRARLADEQSRQLATAQGRAREAETAWRRERAAASRAGVPLVVAPCPGPAGDLPAPAPGGIAEPRLRMATSIRFTREFVRQYDAAWTGPDGRPVFGDPGGPSAPPGAASTIGPDELLEVHGENAARCSDNARRQNALIDLIERLRAAAPD